MQADTQKTYKADPDLRARVQEWRAANPKETLQSLATRCGVDPSRVSHWLGGTPDTDCQRLERRMRDVLRQAARRQIAAVARCETNVESAIRATFEQIRKTADVGLVSGPAGIGKTLSIDAYRTGEDGQTALSITVVTWRATRDGVVKAIATALQDDGRQYPGTLSQADWIADTLRGSDRLVIVDNAHLLRGSGREYLFNLHDDAGIPVALVGNPEVLAAIRKNDQHFSRVGIRRHLELADVRTVAAHVTRATFQNADRVLIDLATAVAGQAGHLRALHKQLMLARDFASQPDFKDNPVGAFKAAHKLLVRDYTI
jgi:DNA transposition AAA+ family ATPase